MQNLNNEDSQVLKPKFELGSVVATMSVSKTLEEQVIFRYLERHQGGDWGDTCDEDKETNESAIKYGDRIVSSYILKEGDDHGERVLIITEADRSATTVMYMSEY